jgi:purine nucleosidase
MKRIASLILFGLLVFNLCFGGEKQKIILDCDLGGDIDDAFAVAMMLTAKDEFDILGICLDYGDTEARGRIALRMLYETGMDHIPVYIGRKTGDDASPQFEYGKGFNKIEPHEQGAAEFIVKTLNAYPGEVILFTVGPVPNMKDVIELDDKALSRAKHIYSMFGDYHFGALEWNVRADIEASQAFISNIDNNITLSGVKVAGAIKWDKERCMQVEARDTPLTDALTELLRLWELNYSGEWHTPILWDCTALGLVLWPELYETREVYMYVDDEGHTVIDEARDPNCKIATDIDVDEFSRRLMDLYRKQNYKRKATS